MVMKCQRCIDDQRCGSHFGNAKGSHWCHSEETRQKMSRSLKGISPWNKDRHLSEEHRKKLAAASMGHLVSEETRHKIGEVLKGRKRKSLSVETKRKMSNIRKRLWQTSAYVKNQMKARGVRPNKSELGLLELVKPLGFFYVGDGQLVIGGKCPDFWDGDKNLIELFGEYWHKKSDITKRILHFKDLGYNCLVIWVNELERAKIIEDKVREFIK